LTKLSLKIAHPKKIEMDLPRPFYSSQPSTSAQEKIEMTKITVSDFEAAFELAAREIEIAGDEMSDEIPNSSAADAAFILIWLSGSLPNDRGQSSVID
jgi:hypothetical protein